jgi:glycosyltransferase involved in cell wall biosynthesis
VSVVLAARDAEATVGEAVESVLAQTSGDLELVIVDDGSTDRTGEIVAAIDDRRVRVLRNADPLGLAGALNVGLDAAGGTYVARMDADDLALPHWLEAVLGRIRAAPRVAVVGTGMIDLGADGDLGVVHRMPQGIRAVRWACLFSSPFFHSTVLLDRAVLEREQLRYDPSFGESEDYDLWARLLTVVDGDNIEDALVLYRKHDAQASTRRAALQRECQRRVALRQISAVAPELDESRVELAWLLGAGRDVPVGSAGEAAQALAELAEAFDRRNGGRDGRRGAAWSLARARVAAGERTTLLRAALRLDPALPFQGAGRLRRRRTAAAERAAARSWLGAQRDAPVKLTLVIPEPTPFRTEMLDRVSTRPELDLTVLYAGSTVQRRTWTIEPRHRAVFLEGRRIPGLYRALRHEYPVSLDVFRALAGSKPEAVVVSGWSTFASQAAAAWCRRHRVPYVLLVESNEREARPGWRRAVKGAVVPPIVRGAAEVLVVGRLARESMLARGVPPQRISLFADTIDVAQFGAEAERLRAHRDDLRADAGLAPDDVAVLSIARLAPEKGLDTLVRAVAWAADPRLVLVLAGSGAERERLVALAEELGVRLVFLPDIPWERIVERFAIADVFALLSRHEPWGVVVNEAAACGLPLVVSDRVGAAFDLVDDGHNGWIVAADDPAAAGAAIRTLAGDPGHRRAAGAASRELMREWDYEPSIENLIRVARRVAGRPEAVGRKGESEP